MSQETDPHQTERLRRWRLLLGSEAENSLEQLLTEADQGIDQALAALYEADERTGGLGDSAPKVARWLGDIRTYFPTSVVQVMQQDALERLNLRQMLLEPELLAAVEPDVHLVADLLALSSLMPNETRETARQVVRHLVQALEARLANRLKQAVRGSLSRSLRNRRPTYAEIDWPRTIQRNLKHYQPQYGTIIPAQRVGSGRKRAQAQHLILCLDQSDSMGASVIYASIFGAVLASIPALKTNLVIFDTTVVDLTPQLADPVELLFGLQLGGGTDICQAVTYCQSLIQQPQQTTLVLITDLYEGGEQNALLQRVQALTQWGVQIIVLLALNDDGLPAFNHHLAAKLGALGLPILACTPDHFPELMATALAGQNISAWASTQEFTISD
jgi:Mg-chelatase subunit ChlD